MSRPLRIALLSKATAPGGGASRMAETLADTLRRAGHDATHFVGYYSGAPRPHLALLYGRSGRRPIAWLHGQTRRLGYPEILPLEYLPFLLAGGLGYDILHVHDAAATLSPLTISWLARRRPLAWTFHDCSPFTGGCLYPRDCRGFESDCRNCPQAGTWPLGKNVRGLPLILRLKRNAARAGYFPAAPSAWMADLAMRSGMFPARPTLLANGVDTDLFRPGDRAALRRDLGLPADRPVVLLAAGALGDSRKGGRDALAVLDLLEKRHGRPFHLLAVGRAEDADREAMARFPATLPGYVADTAALARLYAAADVHLSCTLADNQPLTVLETMACGVPTVGFASGGMPELVPAGCLARPGDVDQAARRLAEALAPGRAEEMGRTARERAERDFSLAAFRDRHLALYATMLDRWGRP